MTTGDFYFHTSKFLGAKLVCGAVDAPIFQSFLIFLNLIFNAHFSVCKSFLIQYFSERLFLGFQLVAKFLKVCKWKSKNRSTVAQMAERAPRDRKVPSLNPALDPMRRVSK